MGIVTRLDPPRDLAPMSPDLKAVFEAGQRRVHDKIPIPPDHPPPRDEFLNPFFAYYTATVAGQVRACVSMRPSQDAPCFEFCDIAFADDSAVESLGPELVAAAISEAREKHWPGICGYVLSTDLVLHSLFTTLGFQVAGIEHHPSVGASELMLCLRLDAQSAA